MPRPGHLAAEYRPFPNEGSRNWRQEHVEIPLMLRALDLPRGARVLEIGCGRGVALPVASRTNAVSAPCKRRLPGTLSPARLSHPSYTRTRRSACRLR